MCIAYWHTESSCLIRRCVVIRKKSAKLNLKIIGAAKFGPCCLLAQGASLSPSITQKTNSNQRRIICCVFPIHVFMGTLPKDFALLGGHGNMLKIKTTAKLNSKQTSIARVRDIFWMYATVLIPLGSHYRLPLKDPKEEILMLKLRTESRL